MSIVPENIPRETDTSDQNKSLEIQNQNIDIEDNPLDF